ncbi:sulfite exporter TauE/SafE family protein [Wukongibacter baidiensis]|uniref:HoxN/HupN/NixA family nickel/cobalt transporter n=1 Tax=Wukongibacter baidiensis TaxID=1723361 RepID=UPI003D7F9F37
MPIFLFAFLLGFKHAIEPDHIVSVSNIVSTTKNIRKAAMVGVTWGMGHTATLLIIGMIAIMLKQEIPTGIADFLEIGVGIMIIFLGVRTIINYKKNLHSHGHSHNDTHGSGIIDYIKSLSIGFIQGLAGSAAMVLLTVSTANSYLEGSLFIAIFGLGTIISMLLCTLIIGIPFAVNSNPNINRFMNLAIGISSLGFGSYYVYSLISI